MREREKRKKKRERGKQKCERVNEKQRIQTSKAREGKRDKRRE